jgi:hypothetical protein
MRRTSGRARSSHHETFSRRAFRELTFQVATRTPALLPGKGAEYTFSRDEFGSVG